MFFGSVNILISQAWEEIHYENFGEGFTGQPLPAGWSKLGWHGNVEGATGGSNDPCWASLLTETDPYLAYQMNLSDTYEYYVSINLKTDDQAGAQLIFLHDTQAGASGTQIGDLVNVPIIPYTQPGQVVSSAIFNGLNGAHYFIIGKSPSDPSSGNERVRVDDFRLYRRPVGGINSPPSVSFSNPTDGEDLAANTDISISANATDSDGTVISVKFYEGSTLINEDTSAPFETTITGGLAVGTYTLEAEATDDDGSTATAQITIIVSDGLSQCIGIAQGSDDAEQRPNGNVRRGHDLIELTEQNGVQLIGLRFQGLDIPVGATITEAYLQFTTGDNSNIDPSNLTFHGEATDNPGSFQNSSNDISNRPLTSASANWTPPNWNTIGEAGSAQQTIDLSAIVQEVVDRPGYASGNSIVFIVSGTGRRTIIAYNKNPTQAAQLCVSFDTTANSSPVVSIDSPLDGASLTEGDDINISATATDADGTIQSVQFFYDDTLIAEDFDTPYSVTLSGGLSAGNYTLKAVATDDDGDTSQAQISITVDPAVVLTDSVTVCSRIDRGSDDAEENGNNGQMLVDGNLLDLVNGAIGNETSDQLVGLRFNNLNIPQGTTIRSAYIQFTVYDTNNIGSDELTIRGESSDNPATFSNLSGSISTRSLTTASVGWSPGDWTVTGEAGPLQKTVDIAPIIQELVNRPGFSESSSIAIIITGSGRRSAKSFNNSSSEAPELCIVYGTTPPSVALVTPTEGSVFTEGENITLEATATDSDGTIQAVDFYYGSTLISSDPTAPYTATIAGGLTAGNYVLKAVATDDDGLTAESMINITIDPPNIGPSVSLDTPTEGSIFDAGVPINLTATASDSDGTIQSVQFYHGTTLVDEDFTAPYETSITGGLSAGNYILKAVATDDDGATAENTINITVEAPNAPPLVSINTPASGAIFTEGQVVDFQAIASDSDGTIVQMDLYQGPTLLISNTPSNAPYITTYSINGLSPGTYTLRAVATDDDGAVSEEVISIQIEGGGPGLAFDAIPTTSLGKGDLIFLGFDNDIGNDRDRIIVTNLVDLEPNTSFMITNANYCGIDDKWRSIDSLDGYIPVQRITYEGTAALPAGSAICFDIPGDGDFMITDFMIDGSITTDFTVENIGSRAIPDVNLRKDSTVGHLFLMQGGVWRSQLDYATYSGRLVAPPIRYGADWDVVDCSTGSQLPDADQCIAGPSFPNVGGSVYAYFDCSEYGSQYSPFAFMKEAIDPSKWDIYNGTDTLDLSGTACGVDCEIVQDSIYWVYLPDTLVLDCVDNYQDSIDAWLVNYGNAVAASSCQDSVDLSVTFEGVTAQACQATGQNVFFEATDSCGGRIIAPGLIQISPSAPLSFVQLARDTTIQCDADSFMTIYQTWVDNYGGAVVSNNCLVSWDSTIVQSHSPCGLIDTVWATFHAISVCQDTISTSAVFIAEDNVAPVFTSAPRDTTLNCTNLGYLKQWLDSAGESEVEDNCTVNSLLDITSDFSQIDGQCGSTIVTFMVSDGCGNATVDSATLTIVDDTPPTILAFPESFNVSIADSTFQTSIHYWLDVTLPQNLEENVEILDLCTKSASSFDWDHDYADQLVPGQCDSTIVNISIRDVCGNQVDTNLIIYAVDDKAPYFEIAPDTLSLLCSLDVAVFDSQLEAWKDNSGGAVFTDEIGTNWTVTNLEEDSVQQLCGHYDVLFTVTDDCGNSSSIKGVVQVTDDSPPYFTGGGIESLYISYENASNNALLDSVLNEWLLGNQDERADDNCQDNLAWSTTNPIIPDSSCLDIPIVFYIDDGCNVTTDTSFVNLYLPLEINSLGADLSVAACDGGTVQPWLDDDAGLNVTTGCGEVIDFSYEIDGNSSNCGSQDVVFMGVTPWGDTLSYTYVLTTVDNIAPTFDQGPFDLTINCASAGAADSLANWLATYGNSTASDDCEIPITWFRNYESLPLSCGSTTVAFTIKDACENTRTETATVTILDQQAPDMTTPPAALTIYLEPTDLGASGSNPRIEDLIQDWLDSNGGAVAIDTTYCASQEVGPLSSSCASDAINFYPYDESFELGNGNWIETTSHGAWTRNSGSTPTNHSGPPWAVDGSYYLYTEADGNYNETAILEGPCFDLNEAVDAVFSFRYHMRGNHTGTLTLQVRPDCDQGSWQQIWSVDGNQNDQWHTSNVPLTSYAGQCISLRFVADIGPFYNSDMAIDQLQLSITDATGISTISSENLDWDNDYSGGDYAPTNCDSISVTFTVSDACGNQVQAQSFIQIIDTLNAPIIDTLPQDLIIACDEISFDSIVIAWLNNQGNGHAYDPAGGPITWSHSIPKPIVPYCSAGTATFTAMNACGMSTDYVANWSVEDNIVPTVYHGTDTERRVHVNSAWNTSQKEAAVGILLDTHAGASATDNCTENILWENDFDSDVYNQSCGTYTVTFTAKDDCENSATTTGEIILYQEDFNEGIAEDTLFLTCCALDTIQLDEWLANAAYSTTTTLCGDTLNWDYSGYDSSAIDACIDQTVTFSGGTPYGDTYSFTGYIVFNSSACCDDLDVGLSLIGGSGAEQVFATPTNCTNPLYTWYFNGAIVAGYDSISKRSLPYIINGPGQYEVELHCEGFDCNTRDTLDVCQGFDFSLACSDQLIYHDSDHNCQQNLERKWFLDGQQIAAEGDYVSFDDFGTYSLEATCDSACYSTASLTLSCGDVQLELAASMDSVHVTILGCYPSTGTISWYIDNVEQTDYAGEGSIEKLGNGLYEARLTFSNNACVITETLDLCEELTLVIIESSGKLIAPAPKTGCYTAATPEWYLDGSPPTYLGSGFEWIPTVDGVYRATYTCSNGCSATTTYNWTSPCNDLAVEAIFVDDNFGRIDVSVSGTDRCSQLLYNWYFRSGTGSTQLIEQDRTFPYYTPNNFHGTGYYSVEVRCQDGDTDCVSTVSDEIFYSYNTACDYGVNITRSGNTLTANLTGDPCSSGSFTYFWERIGGGQLVGPFDATREITNGSEPELYRVTVSCGSYCEAYAEYLTVPCDMWVNISNNGQQLCANIGGTSCTGETPTYIWRRNGYILAGATSSCYAPLTSGQYSVEVICGQDPSCTDLSTEVSFSYVDHCDLQVSITEDGNGQLCGNISGSSCDGEVINYEWSKNGVLLSTNSCYTPNSNGFYQLLVSCDDGTTYCEEITYNSYQIGCDLTANIQQNGRELCAITSGNSCNGFPRSYTWYRDGLATSYSGSCIVPKEDGVFTVVIDCGGCSVSSPGHSFSVCGPSWIEMTPIEVPGVSYSVLRIKVNNFCGTPLISPQHDEDGEIYNLVVVATDEYHIYVDSTGCYSVTTSDNCDNGVVCNDITTDYCFKGTSALVQQPQPDLQYVEKATVFDQLNIFPNPTQGEFNINMYLYKETALQLSMYDANGKIVLRDEVDLFEGQNQLSYATDQLSEGVYIIRLQTKDELIHRKLMVIK